MARHFPFSLGSFLGLTACATFLSGCGGHGGQSTPPTPVTSVLQLNALDIAYDVKLGRIYVCSDPTDANYHGDIAGFSVKPLKPIADIPQSTLANSFVPSRICVSSNGKQLFVAGKATPPLGNTQWAVTEVEIGVPQPIPSTSIMELPNGNQASRMVTNPKSAESFAVSVLNPSGTDGGTVVFDGLVPRPNTATIGSSISMDALGSKIYGLAVQTTANPSFSYAPVSPIGLGKASSSASEEPAIAGGIDGIHWANGKIVTDYGNVLDPATGNFIGSFDLPANTYHMAVPVPGTNLVYYVVWPMTGSTPLEILTFSLLNLSVTGTPAAVPGSVVGPVLKAVYSGNHSIAFMTSNSSLTSTSNARVVFVSGLP